MLVIAGFHRSGTSLLAELLHRAGLFVGEDLLGAMPSNPYGHFEDREVVELHGDILEANGASWHIESVRPLHLHERHWERMGALVERRELSHRHWGFKDPRACFFLGAWKHLVPDAKVVVVYRGVAASVASLERRQAQDLLAGRGPEELHERFWQEPDHALKMWWAHNRMLLSFVDAHREDCLVLPFRYLREGFPLVEAVNRRFRLDLEQIPTSAVFDPSVTGGYPSRQAVSDPRVRAKVETAWAELEERRIDPDDIAAREGTASDG